MSSRSRDQNAPPPKVVIIDTKYVETDAVSFKDVVQRLTGKDSEVDDDRSAPTRPFGTDDNNIYQKYSRNSNSSATGLHEYSSRVLTRDISFKDFERLLREMPPMDELIWVD